MKNSGRNVEARVQGQLIGTGQIRDLIVAYCEVHQCVFHLIFRNSRIESEKCIREFSPMVVQLGRIEVHFMFTLLAHARRCFIVMMDMMRKRIEVVEQLRIYGPAFIFLPKCIPDDRAL